MNPLEVLMRRRDELDAVIAKLDRDDEGIRVDRADANADDEHDPEGSTLSGEWQRIEVLRRSALAERAEVEQAMGRVAEGTYGVCIRCGNAIAPARLEARPMATMCVECAARV